MSINPLLVQFGAISLAARARAEDLRIFGSKSKSGIDPRPCIRRVCGKLHTGKNAWCSAACCLLDRAEKKGV